MTVRIPPQDAEEQQAPSLAWAAHGSVLQHGSQQLPATLTPTLISVNANVKARLVTNFTANTPLTGGIEKDDGERTKGEIVHATLIETS
jgi:hypothetical protein